MKVFVLGTRGFPGVQGGIEKHCEELYPRLVKLGCEVVVCTRRSYIRHYERNKQWNGVSYKHVWAPKKKDFESIVHTFLGIIIARLNSIKILHIHAVGPAILTPFAKILGMKVIFTHHGPDYQRKKWRKFAKIVLRLGEYLGLKFADRVVTISRLNKKFLEEKYKRKDIAYIPNGVTLPLFELGLELLKKYGLEPKKYIFTACRFVPEKGLHDLVEAYKKINTQGYKLVIAGDADHETYYSRRLKKDAKDAGVLLTGFLSGKPLAELYSNAALFVLPSYYEGMPIVLLEALSYGLPLLVSDIQPNREITLPEFRYFKVGDIDSLSIKMQELIKKGISNDEKEAFSKILNKDYNWEKIAESTYNLFVSKTVCVICSSGGHLLQAVQLAPILKEHTRIWVTFKKEDALSLLNGEERIWAYHPTQRNFLNLFRNFLLALRLLFYRGIDVLISTGAGVAIPFFILARLMGKKTIFIESFSRVNQPSLTGMILYHFSDYFLIQWENLKKYYPKAIYKGKIL